MSRKDYQLIASALAATRPRATQFARSDQWNAVVAELTVRLSETATGFDPNKFVEACHA